MPATKHTDPHSLPHCGDCMLNFDTDLEFLEHLEQVEHEVTGFFMCQDCKTENIPYKVRIKQDPTEPHVKEFCDPCLAKRIADLQARQKQ